MKCMHYASFVSPSVPMWHVLSINSHSFSRYSTKDKKWFHMPKLQQKRFNMSTAVLDGKIYVVGGYNTAVLASVECYDPKTNQWRYVARLNVARYSHQCCTINGSIYAVAGHNSGTPLSSIEKYDKQIDKWLIVREFRPIFFKS